MKTVPEARHMWHVATTTFSFFLHSGAAKKSFVRLFIASFSSWIVQFSLVQLTRSVSQSFSRSVSQLFS